MDTPLLTIGIPTYNRAGFLTKCLTSISEQLTDEIRADVHVLISNNASTDTTREVVEAFRGRFARFDYVENETNIGADGNIAQAFRLAIGQYVWVFSDDDILLPNRLVNIVRLMKEQELSALFLQPTWYKHDIAEATIGDPSFNYKIYQNPLDFMEQVHYWVGFITGNIANKRLVENSPTLYQFDNTNLIQLGWTMPAIFSGKPTVRVFSNTILGRATDSVGYNFFATPSINAHRTLGELVQQKVIPERAQRVIAEKTLTEFFPQYLQPGAPIINGEKPFWTLLGVFWPYRAFWTTIVPLFGWRIAYPVTNPVKRKAKGAVVRVLDKLLSVTENARTQRLTDQLGSIGLNSHLPVQATITNARHVFIGRRLAVGNNLKIEVHSEAIAPAVPRVSIGDDVTLGTDVHIACAQEVSIGNYVQLGNRVYISDYAPDRSPAARQLPPAQRRLRPAGPVRIGARALLEDGVCVLGGVTIGEGAIVLAGTIVERDVEPHAVVGGRPTPELAVAELA